MKIGYFINFKWLPARNGAGIHASQIAQELIKKGHSFHKIFYDYDIPIVKHYKRSELFKFLKEIDVIYIRVHEELKTDMFTLLKLLKFSKLPVVWEINAPLEENLSLGHSEGQVRKLQNKRLLLAKFVDASISTCDELCQYARDKLNIKNSFSIPLGSDPEKFSPQHRNNELFSDYQDCFKVVWAGSAQYKWQALDAVYEIAKKIHSYDKKIIFFIVGKKKDQDLKHLEYDNIKIIDRLLYDEVPPYIASCDAGLCLYNHQPGADFYRSPLKLFDYMACGLPVISTRVGQINKIIRHRDNGLLVEDNSIDKVIDYILYLKKNADEAKRMGMKARQDIEGYYNWTRVAAETEDILLKLLPRG